MSAEGLDTDQQRWPTNGECWGQPLPDVARIPEDRWRSALGPLTAEARRQVLAHYSGRSPDAIRRLRVLVSELDLDEEDRERRMRAALARGVAPVAPTPEPPAEARWRQVNLKLKEAEHAQLRAAAEAVGLRPTQLARQLVLNGVRRMRYEERRMAEG